MAMSELKQKLLLNELAKAEITNAVYEPQNDVVRIQTDNDGRSILINDDYEVRFLQANRETALFTVKPLVDKVSETISQWENANAVPFENLAHYRILAEYNSVIMAARDDTEYGRGLYFVTWQYNYDRTGLDHGHYTEDYNACKEDFAIRSGLISKDKILMPEQVEEIIAAIAFRINIDDDMSFETEHRLESIAASLRDAYPLKESDGKTEQEKETGVDTRPAPEATAETIFGDVKTGDWVIAVPNNDYGYLLGTVIAIDKLGTPEHDTENETDDIHVDFTAFDYPPERISEIEKDFSDLYDEEKSFDELPLDDVIMAPRELIRITHLGQNEITFMGNLRQNCETFCNSFVSPSKHHGAKFDELVERVDKNLADYHKTLDGFGQGELIDMAGRIDAMNEAHHYLTLCYDFSADELDFYLQFENPLEIVADKLTEYRNFSDDLDFSMENLNEQRDMLLTDYLLIKKADATVDNKPPEVPKPPDKAEKVTVKEKPKKTLEEKMKAAKEKVKEQDAQTSDKKSHKRDERD